MSEDHFPAFPPCCKKVLEELYRDHKEGGRNCARGHSVSLDRARSVEQQQKKPATPQR